MREQDYLTVVTTYKMTDDLTISRVEIEGLVDQDVVERAWSLVDIEPTSKERHAVEGYGLFLTGPLQIRGVQRPILSPFRQL